jgi:hypothetical protein
MIFGLISAACLVAAAALLVRLHTLFTGFSPISGGVDDLGQRRYHPYYRAMVVLLGLAAFVLAVGLARDTDAGAVAWLSIYGGSRVAIAGVMTDPRRAAAGGWVHLALLLIGWLAIALAGVLIQWDGDPSFLRPLGFLVAACALAAGVTRIVPRVRQAFGGAERALYVTTIGWLGVAAVDLVVA